MCKSVKVLAVTKILRLGFGVVGVLGLQIKLLSAADLERSLITSSVRKFMYSSNVYGISGTSLNK